jgi:hypothetical protein
MRLPVAFGWLVQMSWPPTKQGSLTPPALSQEQLTVDQCQLNESRDLPLMVTERHFHSENPNRFIGLLLKAASLLNK